MSPHPPRRAAELLARLLRDDPARPAILGDLLEDYLRLARANGEAAAGRWYWKEVLSLAGRRWMGRSLRRSDPRAVNTNGILADARHAFRTIRRRPSTSLLTAAVIGLGVGGATAVFSVLEPFVLAPLPFESPGELVWIENDPEPGEQSLTTMTVRSANLHDLRIRSTSFSALGGFNPFFDHTAYTLTGVGDPVRLIGADVTHDFLDVLGIRPLHGRVFNEEEGLPGAVSQSVILTHGLWVRLFGGDSGVIGSHFVLDGSARTIVGVLPESFDFSSVFSPGVDVDFLLPFPVIADGDPGFQGNTLYLVGRLRPGATIASADEEVQGILRTLEAEAPGRWGLTARVELLAEHIGGPLRPTLLMLVAASGLLLAIVCINLSNLALARAPRRAREAAIRKALGASRGRLIRELVLEAVGLGLMGALFGGALAWALVGLAPRASRLQVPLLDTVTVDGTALAFAVVLSVLTGVLTSLVPALRVVDGTEAATMRSGARGQTGSRGATRTRELLIVGEVATAFTLLVAGGLLAQSFRAAANVDLGFEPSSALAWQLAPSTTFDTSQEAGDYFNALTDRVRALRDIDGVGLIDALPLGRNRSWPFSVLGQLDEGEERRQAFPHIVDAGYFGAMEIDLIAGRGIERSDAEATTRVVVLNESGARSVFGSEPALGERMKFFGPWEWEVVGVVEDVRHVSPEAEAGIQAYFPIAQIRGFHTLDLIVRTSATPAEVTPRVARALQEVDPSMPVHDSWTLRSTIDRSLSTRSFTTSVLGAFGLAALLLAGLGVYGVLATSVAEREREMRIRVALGASTGTVIRGLLGRTAVLTVAGIGIGGVGAVSMRRLFDPLLYGVGSVDPTTYLAIASLLLLLALAAATPPASRAARSGSARGGLIEP